MYCILQLDNKSNEKVVGILGGENGFFGAVNCLAKSVMGDVIIKQLDGITPDNLLDNKLFNNGHYLLNNGKIIQLVEKYEEVEKGYVYSQYVNHVNLLHTWKLIPFESSLNCMLDDTNLMISEDENTYSDSDSLSADECFNHNDNTQTLVQFNDFNLDQMYDNSNICIVGKRASGKSWRVREIINFLNKKNGEMDLLVFSKTEKYTKFYEIEHPNANIVYDYDEDVLDSYLKKAAELIKDNVKPNMCVVIDDCLTSCRKWKDYKSLMELFYNSRHYGITSILTMQFPMGIPPELRCNFDYVFLLAEDVASIQRRIYDNYAGMFPSFDTFKRYFIEATKNYGSMVIANRGCSLKITDKVFVYRKND